MDDLGKRLRETAREHAPDRERMLARIERGMTAPGTASARPAVPPPAPWLRVAAVTAAVVGALGAGTFALVSGGDGEGPLTVATSPDPVRSPSAPAASPTPSRTKAEPPAAPSPDPTPTDSRDRATPTAGADRTGAPPAKDTSPPAAPQDPGDRDGYLRSDGTVDPNSNAFWAQNNVTVSTERALTALTVELRIAATGGVKDTGSWRSLPEEDFTASVTTGGDGTLVYRWTLRDGVTVPAGEHVFAAQYDHAEGDRDAKDDRYAATATGSGLAAEVRGRFTPAD
ncbi:hypothetical protein [Streptomyces sp. NPDC093109]|uniref:hypothetical protein n=1 Tax=Streptomyces sp. NPDC093109 TaxID=3154977 RepID=UPI00344C3947